MASKGAERPDEAIGVLRRFARRPATAESCELCSRPVASGHQHVIEPVERRLVCVCDACAILFSGGHQKYRRVPRAMRALPNFLMTDAQWDSLLIPIAMAFFYHSSQAGRVVAVYPSPAGATESLLPLDTWNEIVTANPSLATLEPDVEALVANRLGTGQREVVFRDHQPEYYILPIDQCYGLVGLIRLHWKGLSGGADVWKEIARFFADVSAQAHRGREAARA